MQTLERLLGGHKFFQNLRPDYVALLVGCATNVRFTERSFLLREGESADRFFLIREGMVAVEIAVPGRDPIVVQTLTEGEVAGFSWLFGPHANEFDVRALTPVRAFQLDGTCLRNKCDQDPRFGYELMQRFAQIAVQRLQATRLRLLNMYGDAP